MSKTGTPWDICQRCLENGVTVEFRPDEDYETLAEPGKRQHRLDTCFRVLKETLAELRAKAAAL